MDLYRIHLAVYVGVGQLHAMSQMLVPNPGDLRWKESFARDMTNPAFVQLLDLVNGIEREAEAAGMPLCVLQAKRVRTVMHDPNANVPDFMTAVKQLGDRFADYLNTRVAVMLPENHRSRFVQPTSGWEIVIDKFPLTTDDIEEASKCLALGRNTACVYHLSGIVQDALESLSKKLSIALNPTTDTWNGLITKIESALHTKQANSPNKRSWKSIEPFYAELVSDIKAIKNAWRNPTMHFRRSYTDDQAEKAYQRVNEFMIHASTHLRGRRA